MFHRAIIAPVLSALLIAFATSMAWAQVLGTVSEFHPDSAEVVIDGQLYSLTSQTRIGAASGATAPSAEQLLQALAPGALVVYRQREGRLLSLQLQRREEVDMPRALIVPQGVRQ